MHDRRIGLHDRRRRDGHEPDRSVRDRAGADDGTEPSGNGNGQATIAELCVQVCARISMCGSSADSNCASECAADSPPNCEAEFRAFLECLTTAMINCNGGFIAPGCEGALIAADNCQSSAPTGQ